MFPGISIVDNDALTDLSGLEFADTIWARLEICENDALTSLQGLDNLAAIEVHMFNASMIINNNNTLVDLTGLENLRSVGYAQGCDGWDRIEIKGNQALESLKGIENIEAASIWDLLIQNNPLLSDCAVKSICDYLSLQNNYWEEPNIDSNKVGCNSIPEVLEACTFGISEPVLHQSFVAYPNPCEGALRLRFKINDQGSTILDFYSISGQRIKRLLNEVKPGGTYEMEVDMTGLPAGVYFCTLQSNDEIFTTKLIKY
jgi:hypothetical protein